ncbi:glycosyltransferase family A protein [Microvirga sp. 17 mud 1-3]|uniref:glycosyltransferase family 2 protein n=1 Tax=Microvirga sp. 17 mud 1-3 TaxID=2082949 RepID=UPI000D6BF177|nr:glycosyltransferase family A protein [Microvirga sp. 17 mud 1-3]AWM88943.1 glycosyl transferase [Microvirga sp. 17 mud 1-3]
MRSVDVVVPCYRYGHFLRQCVESILTQSGVEVRVLVLDDASPDHTPEVGEALAREDSRVTFHRHADNKGHIATYNEGIEWASRDYFLLLSADDYLLPGALERATLVMESEPEISFSFGNAFLLHEDGELVPMDPMRRLTQTTKHRTMKGSEFIAFSGAANIVPTATAVVRTSLQKQVGGYRPELPHSGDMEMWFRLAAHGSVGFVNAHQAVYRLHRSNMSQGYMSNVFPDLQQRKAAIDYFFENDGSALPDADKLRQHVDRSFGHAAIKRASTAFNEGLPDLSDQIRTYALSTCPDIKYSWPWMKLAGKRTIGTRGWNALRSVQHAISRQSGI